MLRLLRFTRALTISQALAHVKKGNSLLFLYHEFLQMPKFPDFVVNKHQRYLKYNLFKNPKILININDLKLKDIQSNLC